MLTLMPTFESGTTHPANDPVVELGTMFKTNSVDFSLLFSHQMPDLRRLLYRIGLESFPWVNVYDDIQQISVKTGIPYTIDDLIFPDDVTPLFMGRDVYYFRDAKRVIQVHFHDEGFVYWVKRVASEGQIVVEQYDDRGFITTRTVTEQNGIRTKYWLNNFGQVVLTQTKGKVVVAPEQKNRFYATQYHSMQEIVYEFLMKQSMRIGKSLQVITNLNTDMLELRNGQPLLKQMIFWVNQRLNLSDMDTMMINTNDIFIFPTSADQRLFNLKLEPQDNQHKLSKISKYVIPQYATTLDLGVSNETALDLIYWRMGNIQTAEARQLFQKFIDMLQHQDDRALMVEGTKLQVETIGHQLENFASDRFGVNLDSEEYEEVANFIADQRSGKPIAGLNKRGKKLRELPDWEQLSAAEYVVSRIHFQISKREAEDDIMHEARIYVDTETIPDLRLMMLAISNGVPLIVRQESTLIQNQKNGIIVEDIADVPQACSFFLKTLRRWNDALVVNAELIDKFSAERLTRQWKEVLAVGKKK